MKRFVFFLFILLLIFACSNSSKKSAQSKVVLTAIPPQKFILDSLLDSNYMVYNILKEGDNPTTFTFSPKVIDLISKSDFYITAHVPFEKVLLPKLVEINSKIKIVDPLLADSTLNYKIKNNISFNPHTWLSLRILKKEVNLIRDSLFVYYKDSNIIKNSTKILDKIDMLNNDISAYLRPFNKKKFVIFHPSLYYFSKDYNLIEIAIEKEGKEPGPNDIVDIVNIIKSDSIKGLLFQKEFDTTIINSIKNRTNIKTEIISPMEYSLFENLKEITRKLLVIFVDER